jgi:N-acetylneuraminate synthase
MEPQGLRINSRLINTKRPVYIIAELSANHNQDFRRAVKMIEAAKDAGADAVKLQTYTADTLTLDCDNEYFSIKSDLIWKGRRLYDLYNEAYTPWEWQPKLKDVADGLNIDLFSSPFDSTAVDFLEAMNVPAYKIASFELVDIPLIEKIAKTGKPIIMSTGMATMSEIEDALNAIRRTSTSSVALLKCTSAYPANPSEMNLQTIPFLSKHFNVPVGLSDHTMGFTIPVVATALGACIIEKHFTLSRNFKGPDSDFSMEPEEFKAMVLALRTAEESLGQVFLEPTKDELKSISYRRSLFAVKDIKQGEIITTDNVRSIRPGHGLPPKYLSQILGRVAIRNLSRGTPLKWSDIAGN